ncbi:family 16 glycosylhydrolase [Puniceicoccaceae bacterium]|nr:family 16 glycosylhydrolase [Puniceicoccaceae bacterium]
MKNRFLFLMPFLALTASGGDIPMPPVEAPDGYKWVLNEAYSDEFEGTKLDSEKWHDTYPGWKGRVPGLFVPSAISVADGKLQIQSTVMSPPKGDDGEWWISCGAIQTKSQKASYGYYETRAKASSLRTSTTFWLMNPVEKSREVGKRTELDIQECIGNAKRWPDFKHQFRNNTHITYYDKKDEEGEKLSLKVGASTDIGSNVSDDFHRYGCWWVDATTMHFYLDGQHVQTIKLPTEIDPAPMDQKMYVNLVCEIYDWEFLPEMDALKDDSLNTTYYDYVRSYHLVKE